MLKNLRRYFIRGILFLFPIFLTLYILVLIFKFTDGILGKFINSWLMNKFGFSIPGLGLILLFLTIIIFGFLSTKLLGKYIYNFLDKLFSRFPLSRQIYPSLKTIFEYLFSKEHLSFKKAVLVNYPTKDSWTIGFITNEGFEEANKKTDKNLLNVFIPLSPNPISGFLVFVPKEEVIFLDINIEEAMKLIVSGGLLNPSLK